MRITRPRATRLSQITIDVDLDMGAYSLKTDTIAESTVAARISMDSELDMGAHNIVLDALQTVDGKDVSLLNPVGWVLLDEVVNTNTGNILSLDTGTITAMDMYMIIFSMRSLTASNSLSLQINGLTASNYNFVYLAGDTITAHAETTFWRLVDAIDATESANGIYFVQGKRDENMNPSFYGAGQASVSAVQAGLRGFYNGATGDITRLNLYTAGNATGWIKIFGMNK